MKRILHLNDRLRGLYILAVNDGAGPLNGSMTYERQNDRFAIREEAANAIEAWERGESPDPTDLMARLLIPSDLLGLGKLYVPMIHSEAVARLSELSGVPQPTAQ